LRYIMRQRLFSFTDDFYIKNEDGQDVYFVDGKAFSLGNQLSFRDLYGIELAYIKEVLLSWGKTYEIYLKGELYAIVKKELFTFFNCRFHVDVPGPEDIDAEGDFLDHEYAFFREGRQIASVSKEWFTFGDTYGVDIAEEGDDVLILASTVVIDLCCHGDRRG